MRDRATVQEEMKRFKIDDPEFMNDESDSDLLYDEYEKDAIAIDNFVRTHFMRPQEDNDLHFKPKYRPENTCIVLIEGMSMLMTTCIAGSAEFQRKSTTKGKIDDAKLEAQAHRFAQRFGSLLATAIYKRLLLANDGVKVIEELRDDKGKRD